MIADPLGTRIADPLALCRYAATILIFEPAAAAKTGGVLPTPPMSTAPALTASSSGGPEVNCENVIA